MDPKGGRARDGALKGQEQHDIRGPGYKQLARCPFWPPEESNIGSRAGFFLYEEHRGGPMKKHSMYHEDQKKT